MNWTNWMRQVHRWTSLAFAVVVAAIFITQGMGRQPAEWVYFLPLFPLAILLATGLYMFVLPYLGRRHTAG
ncbi:hypothetical protein BLJAPNOD_04978 [Ensifer sp. M14]|uniref:hypothetical protein n=1 Tax=Sinorhizobium/Ensifer group TaxID=227292 RepID=UPI0009864DD5|nr:MULTISPECIES: hypothetical protein [Sinorhizobium/Ensifer group]OOG70915.1 hypothetical protein B0E45_12970 [Sinorhizobium sp. A49]RDL48700.1 hypothetical protein BLJAPNOD_04978 [Ensifer sp. M14]